jgi:hypothetical protein
MKDKNKMFLIILIAIALVYFVTGGIKFTSNICDMFFYGLALTAIVLLFWKFIKEGKEK